MTKKQKKKFISYVVIFIIAVISLVCIKCSEQEKKAEILPEPQEEVVEGTDEAYSYVHFLDVGQGDCTLIETHDGKFALIDASTQQADDKIIEYLTREGVEELEFVLFTHPHEDHIGCGDEVIDTFKVGTVYMTDKTETTLCYRELLSSIANSKELHGTKVIKPSDADTFSLGDIEFFVLSDGSAYSDTNNSSICLRMELGKTTFIFTGDAEKKVENDILGKGYSLSAEIYKCAHHGSSTSNSDDFLDAINPEIAVISCGKGNDYGHPHEEIVDELEDRNILYYRTDIDGDIVFPFNENQLLKPAS